MKKAQLLFRVAALVLFPALLSAAEPLRALVVVPARLRMIQIAFDMQSLRQADVVSWRETDDPENPALFAWSGRDWNAITLEAFQSASFLKAPPQKVIFLGLDTPETLAESASGPGVVRFETFDAAQVVNNLDAFYNFSDSEWRLLAKRHGFLLRDVNAARRSQHRYARPPAQAAPAGRPAPVLFDRNPPPAEILPAESTPAAEPTPAESTPAEPAADAAAAEPAE